MVPFLSPFKFPFIQIWLLAVPALEFWGWTLRHVGMFYRFKDFKADVISLGPEASVAQKSCRSQACCPDSWPRRTSFLVTLATFLSAQINKCRCKCTSQSRYSSKHRGCSYASFSFLFENYNVLPNAHWSFNYQNFIKIPKTWKIGK